MSAQYDRDHSTVEKIVEIQTSETPPKPVVKTKEEYIMDGKKYACSECGQKFVSERAMKVHEATMHENLNEPTEKCSKCGKAFRSSRALETHLKIYHANDKNDDDDFKCAKCGKTYSSQRSLNAHMSSHAREEGYPTDEESPKKWKSYQAKEVTEDEDRVYKVKVPDFINKRNAQEEKTNEVKSKKDFDYQSWRMADGKSESADIDTGIKSMMCKYCSLPFFTQRAVDIHILTNHTEEESKENRRLKKAAASALAGDDEAPVEENTSPFPCEEYGCKRGFTNFQGFKIHMKSSHKYAESDFKNYCDICGRRFSSKNSLNSHVENAHYFHCEQCDQKFQEQFSLDSHVRRMHKKVQNKCADCGASFRSEETLKLHAKIHERPQFKCTVKLCSREFMTKGELDMHIFEHDEKEKENRQREEEEARENAKRWRCDLPQCNKTFLTEKSFKMHEDMHSAEEDSRKECPKCHKRFMSEKSLKFHIETSHPDMDLDQVSIDKISGKNSFDDYKKDGWKCDKCHKYFDSKAIYEYHMTRHENMHKCRECKMEFKTKQGLSMHVAEHEESKRRTTDLEYTCKDCGKECASPSQLQFHISTAHDKTVEGYEVLFIMLRFGN